MTGKLKTKGNMMLATKLDGVLKVSCRETDKEITHPSSFRLPSRRLSSDGGVGLDSHPRCPTVRTTLHCLLSYLPATIGAGRNHAFSVPVLAERK